jgi:hypothetical protein
VPPQSLGGGSRFRVTTSFLNAGGALVRLFGLQNTPLGQTASSSAVDSRLLYVTGFDPVTHAFKYRVNQLFGEPIDYGSARHRYPPFELQLGVEYRFGYPPTNATARNLGLLRTGRDSTAMATEVRSTLLRRTFGRNQIDTIVALRDTLGLTPDQFTSIKAIANEFDVRFDSIIAPVVAFVLKRGKQLTSDELNAQTQRVGPSIRDLQSALRARAVAFLSPDQRFRLSTITRIP